MISRRIPLAIGLTLGLSLPLLPVRARGADASWFVGGSQIDAPGLRRHVEFLSAPELQGRAAGSAGGDSAAAYIERQFRQAGLSPGVGDSTFLLASSVFTGVRVQGVIGMRDLNRGYGYGVDWCPLGLSADGHDTTSLSFAGYGISAPEHGYDDYAGIDARGKIVLAFLGEPAWRTEGAWLSESYPSVCGDIYDKAAAAWRRGALGLILTDGPSGAPAEDPVWHISPERGFLNAGIPVCQVTRSAAAALLAGSGVDLAAAQADIDRSIQPHSVDLPGSKVELLIQLHRVPGEMASVVGKLPGTGDGSVILVAVYDGLGMGPDNAKPVLHPGASDNASGVAALLELARALKGAPAVRRSIYFVALTGRHLESAGALAFLEAQVVPETGSTVLVELAALGRPKDAQLHMVGAGSGSGLAALVSEVQGAAPSPPTVAAEPLVPEGGTLVPFHEAKLPVLGFSTGGDRDYGTPRDVPAALDYEGEARLVRFLYAVVRGLADTGSKITFVP